MSQVDNLVQQAITAYKAGQRDRSRDLLLEAIEINEHHELAWLWLSAVVDNLEEQQICLENVLALNPTNERARKGLETVNRKLAEQKSAEADNSSVSLPDSNVTFAPPQPRSSRGPIGAEFENVSGDRPFAGAPWSQASEESKGGAPEPFDGWLSAAAHQPDQSSFVVDDAPATSVDWERPDKPAVYGSGRQVELPTAQEYDEWLKTLNLDGSPDAVHAAGQTESLEFSLPDESQSNKPSPLSGGVSPFVDDAFIQEGPTPAFDSSIDFDEDDWFTPEERERFGNVFKLDDEEDEPGSGASSFNFDAEENERSPEGVAAADYDDDDGEDDEAWLARRLETSVGMSPAFSTPKAAVEVDRSDYFSYIPAGIEAQSGVSGRSLFLLAAIALLLVLNALSFGILIF